MKLINTLLILLCFCPTLLGQDPQEIDEEEVLVPVSHEGEWKGIPGINGGGIALMDQREFIVLMGSAIASYALSEFVFENTNLNFMQSRFGIYGVSNRTTILFQTFGIEKRVSPWFGLCKGPLIRNSPKYTFF